jgi:hypothetical protein
MCRHARMRADASVTESAMKNVAMRYDGLSGANIESLNTQLSERTWSN